MTPDAPVIYLEGERLADFLKSDRLEAKGIAYEWEGENVYHLHFSPLSHSFGQPHSLLWRKSPGIDAEDYDIVADIALDGSVSVTLKSRPGQTYAPQIIPAKQDLYSRNKGLIELDILEGKRVMIVGLGSFGSQIAIELAKAGVGQFSLMDFDRVELHNLARHTSCLNDLGRLKTEVIADAIKGKNPYAQVDKFPIDINDHPDLLREECEKADLVICATDNNRSRFNLSSALISTQTVGIFGRAITRAEGGDVFRYRPGGPCYCCLLGNSWYDSTMEEITDELSARRDGRIAAYTSAEDADAMVQVGLSADIEPMCNMMVKLALVELSRGSESGISSLEQEFVDSYYMWANRRERNYAHWASFARPGQLPTIMRWYSVELDRDPGCALCGNATTLDTGQGLSQEFDTSGLNMDFSSDLSLDNFPTPDP
ncbi:MAG: ThiF family adenylyltransferase [Bacteroidales bacterium]|nr:ThiF family adenylyltransferase [Bacteroidales bacterium]